MFMPKKSRIAIYSYLFQEGVFTCQKDVRLDKHHILDVKNVHALDAMRSLKSRGFVREVFNWQWFYYFLTDSGVEYLRQYLYLEENVVPATLKKPAKPSGVREGAGDRGFGGGRGGFGRGGFDKEGGYRREGGFRGGFGRGAGAPPAAAAAPAAGEA